MNSSSRYAGWNAPTQRTNGIASTTSRVASSILTMWLCCARKVYTVPPALRMASRYASSGCVTNCTMCRFVSGPAANPDWMAGAGTSARGSKSP